ncbi:Maf family protein [Chitinimonas sp. BJB300]|uniref:Maf family protein n=1 Tax=Chitinimonas sp. BJB300 TaxID=1559339 RepID=UPI000C113B0A|nr:Maf family protein [Chitinimonas sp. BJB300]PHV12351.1 septum formation inhibitor Maf [Chitinimonas sp. BJB300]TSJ91648.1 septum formation inhibitor Maf [Chitinimonas sp. BJB300]
MHHKPAIYLASASPRRRELLTQIGVRFERVTCEIDETPQAGETAMAYVERLARAKADAGITAALSAGLPKRLLLAADTTVALGDTILGKPLDAADARSMLNKLSGSSHEVLTGVAISNGERTEYALSRSTVRFRTISSQEITAYVASGEPLDKAGSYGAQGLGAVLIEEIRGSFSGVVGLPLTETVALLQRFDYPFWPN